MFSWGEDCQQGFRLKDGSNISTTDGVHFLNFGFHITDLSAGHKALAFVKSSGEVFIIRINESKDGRRARGKQKYVKCSQRIQAVSCCDDTVTLLSERGNVLCVDTTSVPFNPRPLEALRDIPVAQVACGSQHSVALTKGGQVYTWGQDSRGQLGLGRRELGANSPQHLRSLSAIPVVQIAAGGEQSFALSVSGGVFGWGGNDCGQLGLGDRTDRHTPTSVHYLNLKKTVHISCGKDHTAILTKDGVVFTFGSGQYGQLGHNSFNEELRPRLVAELWGAKVTKIACGRHHTLVLTNCRRVYSFGCGEQGQLGNGEKSYSSVPLPVQLPQGSTNGLVIRNIFAGENCSFATCMSIQCFLDKDKHFQTSPKYSGLDLSLAQAAFDKLARKDGVLAEIEAAVLKTFPSLVEKPVGVEGLRIFLLLNELLHVMQTHRGQQSSELAEKTAAAIQRLSAESLQVVVDWWSSLSPSTMIKHVTVWSQALSLILSSEPVSRNSGVKNLLLVLQDMYKVYLDQDPKLTDVYRRDFFHHLFHDMVSAKSAMFLFNDSQTLAWFPSKATEGDKTNFFLFGVLCGLALYNQSIIHLPFPLALFKKLLGIEPTLEDLKEFSSIGQREFVDAYVNHVFNTSAEGVFQEFERGFFLVCDRDLVKLFRPEELQEVLVGKDVFDWAKLKQNTLYEWIFHPGHPVIQMFWEVFDELTEDQRKDFIFFLTGYRRVPALGMNQIQMKVRVKLVERGSDDKHYPESLTCHSILELPLYSTKAIMRDRLTEALVPERGFLL
ncbi:putative E3 ubiquitin-protein ligase HERC3 [Symphorus nematophorus]